MSRSVSFRDGIRLGYMDFRQQIKEIAVFQVNRTVTSLFKVFLTILEDQKNQINDLEKTLELSGFEIEKKGEKNYSKYRKAILDKSNDCIRELSELVKKL